jgi:cyanophycin synthetase
VTGGALPADPYAELRVTTLTAARGANYWSTRPVTRLDLVVGAFDDISSADVPGVTDRLVAALPGLEEHRCSIGERGGFITRLTRGTYAPHIIEHVALELQSMVGHDVGYGRSRGGDTPGSYTVVFEHRHQATGLRAAALSLDVVQQAFAGTLVGVEHAVAELRMLAATPDVPPLTPHVVCSVSGGPMRSSLRTEIARRLAFDSDLVVEVNPAVVLQAGLPYATSDVAVISDGDLVGVPERYQEPERAWRLLAVLTDAVPRGGVVIAPAKAWALQDAARRNGCAVAVFAGDEAVTSRDRRVARAAAWVEGGEVVVEHRGRIVLREARRDDSDATVQAAAALAQYSLQRTGAVRPADASGELMTERA